MAFLTRHPPLRRSRHLGGAGGSLRRGTRESACLRLLRARNGHPENLERISMSRRPASPASRVASCSSSDSTAVSRFDVCVPPPAWHAWERGLTGFWPPAAATKLALHECGGVGSAWTVPAVQCADARGSLGSCHARGCRRVRASCAAVFWRQGLHRDASPGREGVLARTNPVPGDARGHRTQLSRGPRISRPTLGRGRGSPHSRFCPRLDRRGQGERAARQSLPQPTADPNAPRRNHGQQVRCRVRRCTT